MDPAVKKLLIRYLDWQKEPNLDEFFLCVEDYALHGDIAALYIQGLLSAFAYHNSIQAQKYFAEFNVKYGSLSSKDISLLYMVSHDKDKLMDAMTHLARLIDVELSSDDIKIIEYGADDLSSFNASCEDDIVDFFQRLASASRSVALADCFNRHVQKAKVYAKYGVSGVDLDSVDKKIFSSETSTSPGQGGGVSLSLPITPENVKDFENHFKATGEYFGDLFDYYVERRDRHVFELKDYAKSHFGITLGNEQIDKVMKFFPGERIDFK